MTNIFSSRHFSPNCDLPDPAWGLARRVIVLSISLSLHREQRELCVKEALQRNTCSQYPGIKDSTKADCLGWVYYLPCHLGASPFSWVQLLIHIDWRLVPCFHSPPNSTLGQTPFHILSFFLTLFNIVLLPVKARLHPSGRGSAQATLTEDPWWGMQHRGPLASPKPS